MKFDDLFDFIGEMGLFQWLVFGLASMVSVLGTEAISVNFVAGYMDHWCKVEALAQFSHEQQKYIAIPQDEDGDYSTCEMYDRNYTVYTTDELLDWNKTLMENNDTMIVSCDDWVYDQSVFVSTAVSKFDLVCSKRNLVPLISTLFMLGILIGSFLSGPLSDRIGRKTTIAIFVLFKLAFGLMGAFAGNFVAFSVARVFLGVGSFSAYLVCYVLVMELVGPVYRTFLGVGFQMAYAAGMMLLSGMAFAIRDDKKLQLAYLLPATVFLLYYWLLPESPRWLLLHKRHVEADRLLRRMVKVNRRSLPENFDIGQIETGEDIPTSGVTWTSLFKYPRLRVRSIVIYLYWFSVNLVYYALSFNIGSLSGSVFTNTAISGAVEIPANILCILFCNWKRMGRKLTCCVSLIIAGIACFIRIGLILTGQYTADTALSFVGRAFVTIGFSGIYVFASEVFPTEARNAGMSFAAVFAQISGMVSPYIGEPLSRVWEPLPVLIFAVLSLASGFSVLVLPETLGHPLFDTIEEAENFVGSSDKRPDTTTPPAQDGKEREGGKVYEADGVRNAAFREEVNSNSNEIENSTDL